MENGISCQSADRLNSPKKKRTEKRKKNAILRWFSSFVVTAVVVVAVVSLSASGATAQIAVLDCVGTDLLYEVSVTDDNKTLSEGSLYIIAESPLDKHEISLQTGRSSGKFTSLLPNTEYIVSVVGSAGFGKYSLDKKKIKTGKTCAGRITSINIFQQPSFDAHGAAGCSYYQGAVSLFYNDSKKEVSSVYAEYAFLASNCDCEIPQYTRYFVNALEESFVIPDLPYTNGTLIVRLLAVLKTGETVLLDETSAYAPFNLFTSVYVFPITADSLTVNAYPYFPFEASYSAILFYNGDAVQTLPLLVPANINGLFYQASFTNLTPNTVYMVEVSASYINPYTSQPETQSIFHQQVTTLSYTGGEILSASFLRVEGDYYPMYECPIHIAYTDGQNLYLAVYIDYMFQYYGEEDPNTEYLRTQVTSPDFWFTVEGISYYNGRLDLRLVADTLTGELILDQKTIFTPFIAEGQAYALPLSNAISLIVYPAYMLQDNTLYSAALYNDSGMHIETKEVTMQPHDYGEVFGDVLFENLASDTDYTIEISAYFLNPFTGEYETQIIYSDTVHTLASTTLP